MSALLPESVHAMQGAFARLRQARPEPLALALLALLVLGAVLLEARDWILRTRELAAFSASPAAPARPP